MAPGVQPTHRRSLARFVAYYLGKDGSDVPFGGRADALERLDAWLVDPGSPRRLLVTGPAGRGKSALLLRWSKTAQEHISTAFVPISIRFETSGAEAFYTLLAARLAHLTGRALPSIASDIAGSYAEFCADTLDAMEASGRQLLIVVDGLDEAVGWEVNADLFGPDRRNVHVLVSARPMLGEPEQREGERWLERLGWRLGRDAQTLELAPLEPAGIGSVLSSAGIAVPEDGSLTRELVRLSEGDPLLLGYLIEDLRSDPQADPAALFKGLHQRAAGFGDYFRRWVETQRPIWSSGGREVPTFEAVLALLACAIGPLALNDIEVLLARMGRPPSAVEQPLRDMARFVLRVEGGFVLAHPRLGEHLRTRHFRDGTPVTVARGAIIGWGIDTLDALVRDSRGEAPQYLVRFLVRHMIDAGLAPAAVMRVAELGWLCACEHVEGNLLGYATQLRAGGDYALRRAGPGDPAHGWSVAVTLILNSIRNSATVPPRFLAACVEKGVLSANRALLQLAYSNLEERVRGTIALLPHIAEAQRLGRIDEVLALAEMVPDERARIRARAAAVDAVPPGSRRDALEEALLLEAFDGRGNMVDWILAMEAVAPTMTGVRARMLVEEGLVQVRDDDWRYLHSAFEHLDDETMSYAWERIVEEQDYNASGQTSLGISRNALASLFRFLPEEAKRALWPEALAAARAIERGFDRAIALAGIQPSIPAAQRTNVDEELLAAAEESDGTLNGYILSLADVAANAQGDVASRALELAGERAVLELSREPYSRIGQLAPMLTGDLLERAYHTAVGSRYGSVRSEALESLAPRLNAEQLGAALPALARFDDVATIRFAQAVIASHLGSDTASAAIADYFEETQSGSDPSSVLLLVEFLTGSAFPLVPNLLQLVGEADWEEWLGRAVDPLTDAPPAWRHELLRLILDGKFSAKAVAAIAPHVPEDLCGSALDRIERVHWSDGAPASFLIVALAAVAGRLGPDTPRALKIFESRERQVLDHHWPGVALGIAPLLEGERARRLREHALRIGMSQAASWHETLVPLLELDADPDAIVTAFLERFLPTVRNRHGEALVSRLQGAPLKRLLEALVGHNRLQAALTADPVTRSQLIANTWLEQRISQAEHAPRQELLRAVAEVTDSLVALDGVAGAAAVYAALETVSRRFP